MNYSLKLNFYLEVPKTEKYKKLEDGLGHENKGIAGKSLKYLILSATDATMPPPRS